jgi:hypothetical protein
MMSAVEDDEDDERNKSALGGVARHRHRASNKSLIPPDDCLDIVMNGSSSQTDEDFFFTTSEETAGLCFSNQSYKQDYAAHLAPCSSCASRKVGSSNLAEYSKLQCDEDSECVNLMQPEKNLACDSCDQCTASARLSQPCSCLPDSTEHPLGTANFPTVNCPTTADGLQTHSLNDRAPAAPDDIQFAGTNGCSKTICSKLRGACSSFFSSFFLLSLSRRDKFVLLCLVLVDLTSQMCLSIMAPFFPTEVYAISYCFLIACCWCSLKCDSLVTNELQSSEIPS